MLYSKFRLSTCRQSDYVFRKISPRLQMQWFFSSAQVGVKSIDINKAENAHSIQEFPFSEETKKQLIKNGIDSLFPVQAATLDLVMQGQDLLCRSKTGSGKTLGFALPIVERLLTTDHKRKRGRRPSAVVLAPTRELAKQVENEFQWLAPSLKSTCLYGGVSISPQVQDLRRGVHIVIGTPGRIIDHLSQGTLDLSCIEFLVLDEADRMLQIGFQEEVEEIFHHLPEKRQNMLWSATLPPWVNQISREFMHDPEFIDLVGNDGNRMPLGIKHTAVIAGRSNRKSVLAAVLAVYSHGGRALVFTQTKKEADDLAASRFLSMSGARPLHGDLSQDIRESTLDAFRNKDLKVIVATDVAARGIDIPEVDLVVHYRVPADEESFVHRCGRTGRAGREGRNVVICSAEELHVMQKFEKQYNFECVKKTAPGPHEVGSIMAKQMHERLATVPQRMLHIFKHQATDLIKKENDHGVELLSAAMAIIAGMENHSLQIFSGMTGQTGYKTLQLEGIGKVFQRKSHVYQFLRDVDPQMADDARRARVVKGKGFVDLPPDLADKLVSLVHQHELRKLKRKQKRWADVMVEPMTILPNELVSEIIQDLSRRRSGRNGMGHEFSRKNLRNSKPRQIRESPRPRKDFPISRRSNRKERSSRTLRRSTLSTSENL